MNTQLLHGFLFTVLSVLLLFVIHHLPINHIFIDPFSEAIKSQDVMDIALSKFRNHDQNRFDNRIFILNSEITDRRNISEAIERISQDEVTAIGLDLLFDSLYNDQRDTILAESFKGKPIVLGYSFNDTGHHGLPPEKFEKDLFSNSYFTDHATEGFINLGTQDGFTVRTFLPTLKINEEMYHSFALEMADKKDDKIKEVMKKRKYKPEWINFRRKQPGNINKRFPINEDALIHYQMTSVDQFLKDTLKYPSGFFDDKLVLIGFCGESEESMSMKDRYFTPLNEQSGGRSLPDMHGVVVHANIISMLLDRDFIYELSEKFLYLISFLIFFVNFFIFKKIMQKRIFFSFFVVRLVQIFEFILFFTLCVILIAKFNIKLGFILIITAVIMSFELFEFYEHKLEPRFDKFLNRKNSSLSIDEN